MAVKIEDMDMLLAQTVISDPEQSYGESRCP